MVKYFIKGTDKEVKEGDKIKVFTKDRNSYEMFNFNFNPSTYPYFLSRGILELKTINEPKRDYLSEAIDSLAKKQGVSTEEFMVRLVPFLEEISLSTAFSMLLKEIALLMDEKYKDHISKSKQIFVVSLIDGRITEVPKKLIRSYKNFAAFRTIEDAREACRILRPYLKKMFK